MQLSAQTWVHRFGKHAVSTLLVHDNAALLVECHDPQLVAAIDTLKLPRPQQILHTHVQAEHCREAECLPDLPVRVPMGLAQLISDRQHFEQASRTTWDHPEDWPNTLGSERYGIAGAVTYRPPARTIRNVTTFKPGDQWDWQGLTWQVIALPGHMAEAVGLVLKDGDKTLACFTGDLIQSPGLLVNLYDLESAYSQTRLPQLPQVLRHLAQTVDTDLYLPATGPVIENGRHAATSLAQKIDHFLMVSNQTSEQTVASSPPAQRMVGRFAQVAPGLYQFAEPGNCIVLIDKQGHGLLFDPGPCDYDNPNRVADFQADLIALENDAGLKVVDQVLVTHMHGDHYDMLPVVVNRYPGCRTGAWAPLARLIRSPQDYPYACLLPWYGQSQSEFHMNDELTRSTVFHWHDTAIQTVHLPGHCLIHAGYLLTFGHQRLAVTGDTIMTNGSPMGLHFIMCNHGAPDGPAGIQSAFQTMLAQPSLPDINLCGHGMRFDQCQAVYQTSLQRIEEALAALAPLVAEGDLHKASIRPEYSAIESPLKNHYFP
jgi:glyoxylase-like metal-dependent hydrolase (beta-lactamase superfamily II)